MVSRRWRLELVIKITFARVQLQVFSDNSYQFWQETYRGKKKKKGKEKGIIQPSLSVIES